MDDTDSQEIVVDFGKICRLCLTGDGVLISLFSKDSPFESENKSIPERIMDLMSIKVLKDDGFPSWICHNCLSQVDKCYEFFDMCRTSQVTLNKSYLSALSEVGLNVASLKENDENEDEEEEEKPSDGKSNQITIYYTEGPEIKEEMVSDVEDEIADLPTAETAERKHLCRDCSKQFESKDELLKHRVSVHHDDLVSESGKRKQGAEENGFWTCDPCGGKFNSRNGIIAHLRSKHLKQEKDSWIHFKKMIPCRYCGLTFGRRNVLRHLETVHKLMNNVDIDQKDLGSFDCRICYRPFMRHSSLRNHIEKVHSNNIEMVADFENCEIVWNCTECDSSFVEEVNLIQHYGNKHSKYPNEVDALRALKSRTLICNCGVINANSFDSSLHEIFYHSKDIPEERDIDCPACKTKFNDWKEVQNHLISHHWFVSMSYENECVFCNLSFGSNDTLRIHLNRDHEIWLEKNEVDESKPKKRKRGDDDMTNGIAVEENVEEAKEKDDVVVEERNSADRFACDTCGICYKTEEELQDHRAICQNSHFCKRCGKAYKSENSLKRHIAEYHNTILPIKCPLCPKVFPRKMNLHNHYKRRHLKLVKKYVCSYCGLSLKGKVALRSHEDRLHRNIRSYKCSECPEAFTTRTILRKHAQRHMTERPMLQCQYCDKKFSTISGIERHVKTHEGVKEFTCDLPLCGKSFYTKSELKRHIKFHTRDFRHACPVCNHKFMSPGELKKHSTKHTGERPFKCHLCSCAYARRDDKVKHLKRVHNLKVKRIYGKPLKRYSDDETDLVDTIIIDECSSENTTENSEIVYSNLEVTPTIIK